MAETSKLRTERQKVWLENFSMKYLNEKELKKIKNVRYFVFVSLNILTLYNKKW